MPNPLITIDPSSYSEDPAAEDLWVDPEGKPQVALSLKVPVLFFVERYGSKFGLVLF